MTRIKKEEEKTNLNSLIRSYLASYNSGYYFSDKKIIEQITNILNSNIEDEVKKSDIVLTFISEVAKENNGIITNKMLKPFGYSREYLNLMVKSNILDRVDRGIYCLNNFHEDSYYIFQQKYTKAIFSHMNSLYFYKLTEEYPTPLTITIPASYHVDKLDTRCQIYYANKDIYNLGTTTVSTPYGNHVVCYDVERTICDIIKDQNKLDFEQIKKSVRKYMGSNVKDIYKLSNYARQMKIENKVMSFVGMYSE